MIQDDNIKNNSFKDGNNASLNNGLRGHFSAIVTPFDGRQNIDIKAFSHLLSRQFCNSAGVVIAGSTGEGKLLKQNEIITLLEVAHNLREKAKLKNEKAFKVIVGYDCLKFEDFISFTTKIRRFDIGGLLITPPSYICPSQEAIVEFYKKINQITKIPIIVYNNPSRTGVDIKLQTIIEIFKLPNIIGMKESSIDFEKLSRLSLYLKCHGDIAHKTILCGEDKYIQPFYACGAAGWISVVGNVCPLLCNKIHVDFFNNNIKNLNSHLYELDKILYMLKSAGNPVAVKAILAKMKLINNTLRSPLIAQDFSADFDEAELQQYIDG